MSNEELIAELTAVERTLGRATIGDIRALILSSITALTAADKRVEEAEVKTKRELDARFTDSDHLTAKYYQRMRVAERRLKAAREYVAHPGNWGASDGRPRVILGLMDGNLKATGNPERPVPTINSKLRVAKEEAIRALKGAEK